MAIGNKHNSAETRDSQAKYWGGGHLLRFPPTKLLGDMSPAVSAPMVSYHRYAYSHELYNT